MAVSQIDGGYEVETKDGRRFQTLPNHLSVGLKEAQACGTSLSIVKTVFPFSVRMTNRPVRQGILCGSTVRHDNRFLLYLQVPTTVVVAKAIATSLGLPAEELESYRQWGMYLDDLSAAVRSVRRADWK